MIGKRLTSGFRVGPTSKLPAWAVLKYEYEVLSNDHILSDLSFLMRLPRGIDFNTALFEFKKRFGDSKGTWVCAKYEDCLRYTEDDENPHPESIESVVFHDGLVVADDGEGGYLVLGDAQSI